MGSPFAQACHVWSCINVLWHTSREHFTTSDNIWLVTSESFGQYNCQALWSFILLHNICSCLSDLTKFGYMLLKCGFVMQLFLQPNEVDKALRACQVAERKVCVSLLKLGRWFYGFRLPDDYESYKNSLSWLTSDDGAKVLVILNRGAVHEVFRLQVSLVGTNNWTYSMQTSVLGFAGPFVNICQSFCILMPSWHCFDVNGSMEQ